MMWRGFIIGFFILVLSFAAIRFIGSRAEKQYTVTVEYVNGGTEEFKMISRIVPQLNSTGCLHAGGRTLVCGVKTIRSVK